MHVNTLSYLVERVVKLLLVAMPKTVSSLMHALTNYRSDACTPNAQIVSYMNIRIYMR